MWTIAYTLSKEQYNGTVNECRDPLQNPISSGYLEGPAGYVFFVDELLMLRIQKSETVRGREVHLMNRSEPGLGFQMQNSTVI